MRYLAIMATAAVMLLTGCATTIRSDVTAFNAWPAEQQDKSYAFEAPRGPDDTLEYRSYQVLVSNELAKLGFTQAAEGQQPGLLVGMKYLTVDHPVRVIREDPFMGSPWGSPYWGRPGYARFGWGYSRWGYNPYFYDPFRYSGFGVEERIRHQYQRQLRITINTTSGKKLYDVTVQNSSYVAATPHVMPALVQSAFTGFPGQSGVPRRVEVTIDPKTDTVVAGQAGGKLN